MVGLEREKRLADEDLEHLILKEVSDIETHKKMQQLTLFLVAASLGNYPRAPDAIGAAPSRASEVESTPSLLWWSAWGPGSTGAGLRPQRQQ